MNSHSTGPGQGRSFRLAEYFDIELRVHWSFAALAGGLGLWVLAETGSLRAVGAILLPIAMVFTCVVFHEYGHALMARHFGIRTQGITLFPIGGVAILEREPNSPPRNYGSPLRDRPSTFFSRAFCSSACSPSMECPRSSSAHLPMPRPWAGC